MSRSGATSPAELARLADTCLTRRRLSEVHELDVLLDWADCFSPEAAPDADTDRACAPRSVLVGGEGTPRVLDHAVGEISLARREGALATSNALADALDLEHRLPRCWAIARRGEADIWTARRVAALSRNLPLDRVHVVDTAVARVLAHESRGRILTVAEAAVIEADVEAHQNAVEGARERRYVGFSRSDEHGLRTLVARLTAGDAAWIDATVHRLTEILAPDHLGVPVDELRSIALGHLARPAEVLQLLLAHTDQPELEAELEVAQPEVAQPEVAQPEVAQPEVAQPEVAQPEPLNRALAFPADLLHRLADIDWTRLAPRATLYVHVHEATLHGADGVARVEGLGPHTLDQLDGLLAPCRLSIQPVIDLNDRVRTTAYEHPQSLKDRTHLITGGDYWPWATSTSRNVDHDHVTPYRSNGPPGQTGTHNSGPLSRRHHRWKTHAGHQARQSGVGRYVLRSPHGLAHLVDHRGTRAIPLDQAEAILNAPEGVDLYYAEDAVLEFCETTPGSDVPG